MVSIATLGMFSEPQISENIRSGSSGLVFKEEETKRPNIFVKDVEFIESIHKKIKEEITIEIKSIH